MEQFLNTTVLNFRLISLLKILLLKALCLSSNCSFLHHSLYLSQDLVPAQLKPSFETETSKHVFYKPVLNLTDSFRAESKQRITLEYTKSIDNIVKPAYKKLHDYFVKYLYT
jgi:hypothetical protein